MSSKFIYYLLKTFHSPELDFALSPSLLITNGSSWGSGCSRNGESGGRGWETVCGGGETVCGVGEVVCGVGEVVLRPRSALSLQIAD